MPSLYIVSLFWERKRKYFPKIVRVRRELAELLDSLEADIGKEAAGIARAYAAIPSRHLATDDEQSVFAEIRRLKQKEVVLFRKLYSPSCCYRERSEQPDILGCYGISWDDVRRRIKDGKLPLESVLWLLEVVVNGEPVVSGPLFRQRRWLIQFLRRAAELEEELKCKLE